MIRTFFTKFWYELLLVALICISFTLATYYLKTRSKQDITLKKLDHKSQINVEIAGAVENPGVYALNNSSRIIELLKLSGGLINTADAIWVSKNINLASYLEDSQKIYIPYEWEKYEKVTFDKVEPSMPDATEPSSGKTNVNTSMQSDLESLSGIGPIYALKIIENRPYKDISDFHKKSGLSAKLIDNIKSEIIF